MVLGAAGPERAWPGDGGVVTRSGPLAVEKGSAVPGVSGSSWRRAVPLSFTGGFRSLCSLGKATVAVARLGRERWGYGVSPCSQQRRVGLSVSWWRLNYAEVPQPELNAQPAFCWYFLQGTPQKDVVIKPDAPSTLLSEKHADYIASYGTKKDDYVGIDSCQYSCDVNSHNTPIYLFTSQFILALQSQVQKKDVFVYIWRSVMSFGMYYLSVNLKIISLALELL